MKALIHFTKAERWGLTVWSLCISLFVFSLFLWPNKEGKVNEIQNLLQALKNDSLDPPYTFKKFDPNKISQNELIEMGLEQSLAQKWVNYRSVIGKYKTPDDLARIYGMEAELLSQMDTFLCWPEADLKSPIVNESKAYQVQASKSIQKATKESVSQVAFEAQKPSNLEINSMTAQDWQDLGFGSQIAYRIVKFKDTYGPFDSKDQLDKIYGIDVELLEAIKPKLALVFPEEEKLDLNVASVEDLKSLYGIGQVLADRITKFRSSLGGFHSVDQLKEVYGLREETLESIKKRLIVSKDAQLSHIEINTADFKTLQSHPYINYKIAKLLLNYRKHHFPIKSLDGILGLSEETRQKLEPYISFEYNTEIAQG